MEQRVLLAAVETVDLVDEQDGSKACIVRRFSAALISRRRSDTVPPMAETSTKVAFVCSAMTCASEVFPVPAGPKRMTELKLSPSMALRNQLPGPTASICPTTSSSVRGACAPQEAPLPRDARFPLL